MLDVRVSAEFIWIMKAAVDSHEPSGATPGGNFFPLCVIISFYTKALLCGVTWYEWSYGGGGQKKYQAAVLNGSHRSQVSFWTPIYGF
jgi:hypothetical protein